MHWFRRWTWIERLVMGLIFVVTASLVTPGWRHYFDQNPDNSVSIETLISQAEIDGWSQEPVQVVLTEHSINSRGSGIQHCLLVNLGTTPIEYTGYSPDSFSTRPPMGSINPIYQQQVLESSEWQDVKTWKCGVGMIQMRLMPGQGGRFNVYPKTAVLGTRIGISVTDASNRANAARTMIWSQPFPNK